MAEADKSVIRPCEEMTLVWRFQGRRVPVFIQRMRLGDLAWVKVGRYRRRMRVVGVENGDPPEGPYTEVRLAFFEDDAP